MKKYDRVFERIVSPEALFHAWDEFKRGKRMKKDVLAFEKELEHNIFDLHRDLQTKRYRHGPYTDFYIQDPKLRHIYKANVRDRVLHHAMFAALNPIFEPTYIPNSFSCRIGKGTHKGVEILTQMLRAVSHNGTQSCYALKCDVRKFFDSINHDVLLSILERRITDPDTCWLMREIIESYEAAGCRERERERERESKNTPRKGLPIGNLTSQLFANIYLNEFDQFVKHDLYIKHYVRYTDDFLIVSNDSEKLKTFLQPMRDFLRERLKLELHPDKVEIRRYSRGVDFLGYIAFPHFRLLRKKTEKRMYRKLGRIISDYRRGAVSKERAEASLNSYLGILSHADVYRVSERLRNDFWIKMHS
ncbi:MAG: reverse transcriptase/maturase family protein [Minisyncoccia bacterium]|jgi:retron-type reverse transcriptase